MSEAFDPHRRNAKKDFFPLLSFLSPERAEQASRMQSIRSTLQHLIHRLQTKDYYTTKLPPDARAYSHNQRAKHFGCVGELTSSDLRAVFEGSDGNCYWCEKDVSKDLYHIDHYIPLALKGPNIVSNLRVACQPCNSTKHAKDPLQFAEEIGKTEDPSIREGILREADILIKDYLSGVKKYKASRAGEVLITAAYLPQADSFAFVFSKFHPKAPLIFGDIPGRTFMKIGTNPKQSRGIWLVPEQEFRTALSRIEEAKIDLEFSIPLYANHPFKLPDEPEFKGPLYDAENGVELRFE